jgi:flagellar protein FliS
MNLSVARSMYVQDQKAHINDTLDSHSTILIVMKALNKNMQKIIDPGNKTSRLNTEFTNAFTAIYILQSSLDFTRGGEIAENLFRVYEYCRQQMLKAFSRKTDHNLDTCVVLLDEIIRSWEDIRESKSGTGA